MVDFGVQRLNMVESQIRPNDLTDRRITSAMLKTAREAFLPTALHGVAYSDGELVLGASQGEGVARSVLAPRTVAQMVQVLELERLDVVLLVGTGSGYEAAIVADMVQTVVSIECDAALAAASEAALQREGVANAVVVQGPLEAGFMKEGPFDAIFINGGVEQVGDALLDQLKDGGRLVAVRRQASISRLVRWQRVGERFSVVEYGAAAAAVLPGFSVEPAFVF